MSTRPESTPATRAAKGPNMKDQYQPRVGQHIDRACEEAVTFAKRCGKSQTFVFNEVTLTAFPDTEPAALAAKFSEEMDAAGVRWRESEEGKKAAANRREQVRQYQSTHDSLMLSLPSILSERRDALMRWMASFADVADDVDVVKDFPRAIALLEGAGYSASDALGLSKDEYKKPAIMCAYIVGQALSCMKRGMPPHPVTIGFVEDYFKLKEPTP